MAFAFVVVEAYFFGPSSACKAVQSVIGLASATARTLGLLVWHSVNASIAARLPPISSPQTARPGVWEL